MHRRRRKRAGFDQRLLMGALPSAAGGKAGRVPVLGDLPEAWMGDDVPGQLSRSRQSGPRYVLKRVGDVLGAALLLVVFSPVLALCAIAIIAETGRPVFYRGVRLGRNQRRFRIFKLRSMVVGADDRIHRDFLASAMMQRDGPVAGVPNLFKLVDDPRITRVGRVLRRTSLDELPQLMNVLRGEMSLVGPRPEVEYALAHYEPSHYQRFDVLPGITGLWQVGGRSTLPPRQMLELDAEYAARWSLWLDLKILVGTIPAIFSKRGGGA